VKYEDMVPARINSYSSIKYTTQFVISDCRVVECIEGHISHDDGLYSTLYRCPECGRGEVMATAVWPGRVTYRTPEEMEKRLAERREINFNKSARYHEGKQMVRKIAQSLAGEAGEEARDEMEGPF